MELQTLCRKSLVLCQDSIQSPGMHAYGFVVSSAWYVEPNTMTSECRPSLCILQVRSHKWKIDESEVLHSTTEHRLWTFGSMALMGSVLVSGLSKVTGPGDALAVTAALAASYILSDLGTGIYHWGVDNYGGPETPFFGRQIAAFQGHHKRPWTITEREFCNNVHQVRNVRNLHPCKAMAHKAWIRCMGMRTWKISFMR